MDAATVNHVENKKSLLISKKGYNPPVRPQSLLEILDAAHLSQYVTSPYPQRGGIMIVGPPLSLKSTMVESALCEYPNSLILSDINVNTLTQIKDDLASGCYPTIAFPAFEKLYQRNPSTAQNIEGYLMALVEEGFSRASFEDQRMAAIKARTLVIGAMTYSLYQQKYAAWSKSGFLRRFLWCVVKLQDVEKVMEAIHKWELLPLDGINRRTPGNRNIPYNLEMAESTKVRALMREQPPASSTPYVLLKKIACVLKWKYANSKPEVNYMKILGDFSESLKKQGANIVL